MRRTEQESMRMASLVDDLLLLARLDQGRPLERDGRSISACSASTPRPTRAAVAPDRVDHRRRWPRASPSTATRTGCARWWPTSSATRWCTRPPGTPVSVRRPQRRRARRRRGARRRPGHGPRRGRARVRALLPRRPVALRATRGGAGGSGSRHRAGHRRRPRRRRSRPGERAGRGDDRAGRAAGVESAVGIDHG